MSYVLHFAPDNASMIIRLALEHRAVPYRAALVDRRAMAQRSPDYLALNPNGLIPVLETPEGPIFETGAILLWLSDRHGRLGPDPASPHRGDFLKWLFFLSNTPHALLRQMFYTENYVTSDHVAALRDGLARKLTAHFHTLDRMIHALPAWHIAGPSVFDFYLAALLRWSALYPTDAATGWFRLRDYPALFDLCAAIEDLPACAALQKTEGLGRSPFTDPQYPNPPIGHAT